jgi:hypothetical protein
MTFTVDNYFNYFTEIEEQYLKRRGGGLLLSTLDWALIETWKEAGIPLEAVLRGIDAAFDRYDQRPSKTRKVNSLAYCTQEVLAAAEDMKEAAVGTASPPAAAASSAKGLGGEEISAFCLRNADRLVAASLPERNGISAEAVARGISERLREIAAEVHASRVLRLEDVERHLTALEDKLFAALLTAASDEELVSMKAAADRELQPYRSKMPSAQIAQLQKQYVNKRLLEKCNLPRISLFYL